MDKERRLKKRRLEGPYYDFFFETKKYIKELGLNKICFEEVLSKVVDQIYEAQSNKVPVKQALGKDPKKSLEKMTNNMPRKTKLQSIVDTIFMFFISMAFLLPIIYIVNFTASNEYAHNKGLMMYFESSKLFEVVVFAVIITVAMMLMNKVIMKDAYTKSSMVTSIIFASVFGVFALLLNAQEKGTIISFNFLIVELILIVIGLISYFFSVFSYAKSYKKYYEKK